MYFYILTYSDWDEFSEKVYMSDIEYSQSDFESFVLKVYERRCYEVMNEESISLCYPNIYFGAEWIIFDKKFDDVMKSYGFVRSSPVPTARMDFGNDNNRFNQLINERFNDLIIDDSCKDDCWRLKEEDGDIKDILHCKKRCVVTQRKKT